MKAKDNPERRNQFVAEFNSHEHRDDGLQTVYSLCYGLTALRTLLFTRVHEDVERNIGSDSVMLPFSPLQTEEKTRLEIEVFQVAISTVQVQNQGYITASTWYCDWLRRLRLDDDADQDRVKQRLERYLELSEEERRLGFSRVLEKTFPEATRAPLVLYRLFPLGVSLATALAFGDRAGAVELRSQQISWLPSITDCQECRGQVLENGERCATCSNPLWNYEWLNAPN